MQFRSILTKLLTAFAILLGGTIAGGVGWALAVAVQDAVAARFLGWLALAIFVVAVLAGAALIATMALWMLAESPLPTPLPRSQRSPDDRSSDPA